MHALSPRTDRLISVVVGALVSYAFLEMAVAYVKERRERFTAWRDKFVEPFVTHPGRREWLAETLMREEMRDDECAECHDA